MAHTLYQRIGYYSKFFFVILVAFGTTIQLQAQVKTYKVKYISSEFVYIDAGSEQGISIGDSLEVFRNYKKIAGLKVVYTAGHSASCKIINQQMKLQVGDPVTHRMQKKSANIDAPVKQQRKRTFDNTETKGRKTSQTSVSGSIALQAHIYQDISSRGYDFLQPGLRFRLRAKDLWGKQKLGLRIRFRSRYDNRSRRLNYSVAKEEWRNRLSEAAIYFEDPAAAMNFRLGRIISNVFSGVGFIDGLMLKHNINSSWRWGIFAGSQPEWQYSGFQTSLQKYGMFVSYVYGQYGSQRFETNLSLAGVYHGSTVSRELVYLNSQYQSGRNWRFYQSMELDINRDWRKEKTGETLSLSGLYLTGNYRITNGLSAGLSYDSRKNYYLYEYRTIADSLFDDAARRGLRANMTMKFLKDYRLLTHVGIRKRESESNYTYSYSVRIQKNNFFLKRMSLSTRLSGFNNLFTSGLQSGLRVGKTFRNGFSTYASYNAYAYRFKADDSKRIEQRAGFTTRMELPASLYLSADYNYNFGDDLQGHRVFAELGYRF